MTVQIEVREETAARLQAVAAQLRLSLDEYLARMADLVAPATENNPARKSLLGAYQHMGLSVTPADIEEVRREAWQNFPREIAS